MAAVTPTTVVKENAGSMNKIIAIFTTAINDSDTWTQSIPGYVYHVFQQTNNPTTQASAGVSVVFSSGAFNFYPGENAATGTLVVYVKA